MPDNFSCFLSSVDFSFKIYFFKKVLSGTLCQKVAASRERLNKTFDEFYLRLVDTSYIS